LWKSTKNCPVTADPCTILQVDSAALQTGFDGLTTANQQLTDDAVGNKASYDMQKASYNKLQVRTVVEVDQELSSNSRPVHHSAGGFSCAADGL
jgi:hypothetical protein